MRLSRKQTGCDLTSFRCHEAGSEEARNREKEEGRKMKGPTTLNDEFYHIRKHIRNRRENTRDPAAKLGGALTLKRRMLPDKCQRQLKNPHFAG